MFNYDRSLEKSAAFLNARIPVLTAEIYARLPQRLSTDGEFVDLRKDKLLNASFATLGHGFPEDVVSIDKATTPNIMWEVSEYAARELAHHALICVCVALRERTRYGTPNSEHVTLSEENPPAVAMFEDYLGQIKSGFFVILGRCIVSTDKGVSGMEVIGPVSGKTETSGAPTTTLTRTDELAIIAMECFDEAAKSEQEHGVNTATIGSSIRYAACDVKNAIVGILPPQTTPSRPPSPLN